MTSPASGGQARCAYACPRYDPGRGRIGGTWPSVWRRVLRIVHEVRHIVAGIGWPARVVDDVADGAGAAERHGGDSGPSGAAERGPGVPPRRPGAAVTGPQVLADAPSGTPGTGPAPPEPVIRGPLPRAAETARLIGDQLDGVPAHVCEPAGDYVPYTPRRAELPADSADFLLAFVHRFPSPRARPRPAADPAPWPRGPRDPGRSSCLSAGGRTRAVGPGPRRVRVTQAAQQA